MRKMFSLCVTAKHCNFTTCRRTLHQKEWGQERDKPFTSCTDDVVSWHIQLSQTFYALQGRAIALQWEVLLLTSAHKPLPKYLQKTRYILLFQVHGQKDINVTLLRKSVCLLDGDHYCGLTPFWDRIARTLLAWIYCSLSICAKRIDSALRIKNIHINATSLFVGLELNGEKEFWCSSCWLSAIPTMPATSQAHKFLHHSIIPTKIGPSLAWITRRLTLCKDFLQYLVWTFFIKWQVRQLHRRSQMKFFFQVFSQNPSRVFSSNSSTSNPADLIQKYQQVAQRCEHSSVGGGHTF